MSDKAVKGQKSTLPSPAELKELKDIYPYAPELIFKMAEREQVHQYAQEEKSIITAIIKEKRLQTFVFCLTMCALLGAFVMGISGHGYSSVITVAVVLTTYTFYTLRSRRRQ